MCCSSIVRLHATRPEGTFLQLRESYDVFVNDAFWRIFFFFGLFLVGFSEIIFHHDVGFRPSDLIGLSDPPRIRMLGAELFPCLGCQVWVSNMFKCA